MRPLHASLVSLPAPLGLNPLSPATAHLLSFVFTSGYVGSIYLSNAFSKAAVPPHARKVSGAGSGGNHPDGPDTLVPEVSLEPITTTDYTSSPSAPPPPGPVEEDPDAPKAGERDHPATIRRRMKAVGVATVLSLGGVWAVVRLQGGYTSLGALRPTLTLLGLSSSSLTDPTSLTLAYLLAPTLLLGPLYATWLDGDLPSVSLVRGARGVKWDGFDGGWGLVEWRNYIVGPLTEELVFRSALLAIAVLAQTPIKTAVYVTPLYFGLAHAHHAWEAFKKGGRTRGAAVRAVAGSLFQLTYTTLFGWFAAYNYLRTASVLPPLAAHAYCNFMGIYLPHIAARRHPRRRAAIWAAYGAGIAGFVWGLRRL